MPRHVGPRNHPIPVPSWWSELARGAVADRRLTQPALAQLLTRYLERPPSQPQISRVLAGDLTTLEMVEAVSAALGIPAPVFIATSRLEAVAILQERLRYQQHMEMSAMEAEIDKVEQRSAIVERSAMASPPTRRTNRRTP